MRLLVVLMTGAGIASPSSATPTGASARPITLVALGDSLTAGYNLPASAAFPVVLEKALVAKGRAVTIKNAGVSGDTASAGLARLDWSVPDGVDGVILELGANDVLRGVDPAITKQALEAIVSKLKARGIPVLLAGMRAPPNYGPEYGARFEKIYQDIASSYTLPLYPFFLQGVAGQRALNLSDTVHPTAEGVRVIVEAMLPTVEHFLDTLSF